jgi:hypothetical protein
MIILLGREAPRAPPPPISVSLVYVYNPFYFKPLISMVEVTSKVSELNARRPEVNVAVSYSR